MPSSFFFIFSSSSGGTGCFTKKKGQTRYKPRKRQKRKHPVDFPRTTLRVRRIKKTYPSSPSSESYSHHPYALVSKTFGSALRRPCFKRTTNKNFTRRLTAITSASDERQARQKDKTMGGEVPVASSSAGEFRTSFCV